MPNDDNLDEATTDQVVEIARSVRRDIGEDAAQEIVDRAELVSMTPQDFVRLAKKRGSNISLKDAKALLERGSKDAKAKIARMIEDSDASAPTAGKWS